MTFQAVTRLLFIGAALALVALTLLGPDPSPAHATGLQLQAVTAGRIHTCGLTTEGGVKCWGDNSLAQLGDGTQTPSTTPVDVVGLDIGVAALSAGWTHTCALTTEGGVKCWGWDRLGQLGAGQTGLCADPFGGTFPCSTIPVDVCADYDSEAEECREALTGIAAIAAGSNHTCAVTEAGGLLCWGWNPMGQLGDGTTTLRRAPVEVAGMASGVLAVAGGYQHTCAVMAAGTAKCWGSNRYGNLGTETDESCGDPFLGNTVPCSTTPLGVAGLSAGVVAVTTGGNHTCGLTDTGAVKCWGLNSIGQLGTDTKEVCPTITGGTVLCSTVPLGVPGLDGGIAALDAGLSHYTCALTTAGGVRCWGDNLRGQLGDGTIGVGRTPVDACQVYDEAAEECLTPLSGVAAVAAGGGHTCALTTEGGLKCWGSNQWGQYGNGASGLERNPIPVYVLTPPGPDTDEDGCTDKRELGLDAGVGGGRDPLSFWDFFDTPDGLNVRDRRVSASDLFRVVVRFGAAGDPNIPPLSPPPETGYHTAFDRTAAEPGADPWDSGPPDGAVTAADIALAVIQFGHTCAPT